MMRRLLLLSFLLVLAAALISSACSADDDDDDSGGDDDDVNDVNPPPTGYSYYEEYRWEDWPEMEQHLPFFADRGIALLLAMRDADIGDQDLLNLLLAAQEQGVEVRCWIVLSRENGYWANEKNAEAFAAVALDYADWFLAESVDIRWIGVDMEIDINTRDYLVELLEQGKFVEAGMLLLEQIDPQSFEQAAAIYRQMVQNLSQLGFKTMVVTYPQILDDLLDDDNTIQDIMNMPVSMVEWDEVSTMVYTTHFEQYTGMEYGPWVVYDYARSTVERFGDRASIGLGVVRNAENPDRLAADVAAAKAAGIDKIQIYSYREVLAKPDPEQWHQTFYVEPEVPQEDQAGKLLRAVIQLADLFL